MYCYRKCVCSDASVQLVICFMSDFAKTVLIDFVSPPNNLKA